mmetsp:Transcript_5675/g.13097  ORF Transcript_5675/g.13097 Transcript_5675/m.13097 type:complete len:200 (+) Transcript_5675:1820-2419(+)
MLGWCNFPLFSPVPFPSAASACAANDRSSRLTLGVCLPSRRTRPRRRRVFSSSTISPTTPRSVAQGPRGFCGRCEKRFVSFRSLVSNRLPSTRSASRIRTLTHTRAAVPCRGFIRSWMPSRRAWFRLPAVPSIAGCVPRALAQAVRAPRFVARESRSRARETGVLGICWFPAASGTRCAGARLAVFCFRKAGSPNRRPG